VSIIIPLALQNAVNDFVNVEAAGAVGDEYSPFHSMILVGGTNIVTSLFGNPFPGCIFVGHAAYKSMGARSGYSSLSGVLTLFAALCNAGVLFLKYIPTEVAVGLLIWIGVVITALAFDENLHSRKAHGLAVAVGLIPNLAGWAFNLITDTIQAVDGLYASLQPTHNITGPVPTYCPSMQNLADQFGSALYLKGVVALSQGFLFTSIIW